jgi:hypothetical protein
VTAEQLKEHALVHILETTCSCGCCLLNMLQGCCIEQGLALSELVPVSAYDTRSEVEIAILWSMVTATQMIYVSSKFLNQC